MKLLLAMLLCALTACGGQPFDGVAAEQASSVAGQSGDAGSSAGDSGSAGASGTAGAASSGGQGLGGSAGSVDGGSSGGAGSAGVAGSQNCTPLICRNLATGDVYCGVLTNVCGEQLDCGTSCNGAGSCGTISDPHLCSVTCKQPRCVDQRGLFTCGVQSNACGDQLDCGIVFSCDGKQMAADGSRSLTYPNGRCGLIPDGCGNQITCGECPQGTACDSNGICQ